MGIKKIRATEVTCDGCGSVQVVTDMYDIIGFTGVASEQTMGGGSGSAKWFACASSCIEKAVNTAIERNYR